MKTSQIRLIYLSLTSTPKQYQGTSRHMPLGRCYQLVKILVHKYQRLRNVIETMWSSKHMLSFIEVSNIILLRCSSIRNQCNSGIGG